MNFLGRSKVGDDGSAAVVVVVGLALVFSVVVAAVTQTNIVGLNRSASYAARVGARDNAVSALIDYRSKLDRASAIPTSSALPGSSASIASTDVSTPCAATSCSSLTLDQQVAYSGVLVAKSKATSAGSSGGSKTATGVYRRDGFTDYAFVTDREARSPGTVPTTQLRSSYLSSWYPSGISPADYNTLCDIPTWNDGNFVRYDSSTCLAAPFPAGTVVQYSYRTNDNVFITKGVTATFVSPVATGPCNDFLAAVGWCTGGVISDPTASGDPATFASGVRVVATLPFPDSTYAALGSLSDANITAVGGCVYKGPTWFNLASADKVAVTTYTAPSGTNCGTSGTTTTITPPPLIVVHPNPAAACTPSQPHPLVPALLSRDDASAWHWFGCQDGDAFVSGTSTGTASFTIAADDDIVTVGSVAATYSASNTRQIGLVAGSNIVVYNPATVDSYTTSGCTEANTLTIPALNAKAGSVTLNASLAALTGSVLIQNQGCVPTGSYTFTVNGSVASKWHDDLGETGTGFFKKMPVVNYDARLAKTAQPPWFPRTGAWQLEVIG